MADLHPASQKSTISASHQGTLRDAPQELCFSQEVGNQQNRQSGMVILSDSTRSRMSIDYEQSFRHRHRVHD